MAIKTQLKFVSLRKDIQGLINSNLQQVKLLNEIGEITIKDIQLQTRKGKSIPTKGSQPDITKKWGDRRKRLATVNATRRSFKPYFSNLTFSGQLLDSLKVTIEDFKSVLIRPEGDHDPYQGIKGKPLGKVIENVTLTQYLIDKKRLFLGISKEARDKIAIAVKRTFRRLARR